MSIVKPSTPKGTRDLSPAVLAKRNYLKAHLISAFENYGFQSIETPSIERSETLLGKYGDEGDRLIFKILNSGDKVKNADLEALRNGELSKFTNSLSQKALRYDLTVPFARYVAQYQNDIQFPFRRYQMQTVWRAERPQHGRFQEFLQCDADVVGERSLWQEVEGVLLYDRVFSRLKLKEIKINLNHRKILAGIAQYIGAESQLIDFTVALDKLSKIGIDKVINELQSKKVHQTISKMINKDLSNSYVRLEVICDREGFWLKPHCDIKEKLMSGLIFVNNTNCLLYTSPSPRDRG